MVQTDWLVAQLVDWFLFFLRVLFLIGRTPDGHVGDATGTNQNPKMPSSFQDMRKRIVFCGGNMRDSMYTSPMYISPKDIGDVLGTFGMLPVYR